MRSLLAGSLLLAACAHPPPDWRDEPVTRRAIPAPSLGVIAHPYRQTMTEALDGFGGVRREVARKYPGASGWPIELQDVWLRLTGTLEEGLAVDRTVDRQTLIRARVATEVELDRTTQEFGPCPPGVAERLGKVYGLIAHHIRAARRTEKRPAFDWPVSPIIVTSGFGVRFDPLRPEERFHSGLDLGGSVGDVVIAAASGRVEHAGWMGGYGKAVVIVHPSGVESLYGHLRDVLVEVGAMVEGGDAVGLMGSSGRSTGPHLHFEIRKDGAPIDPHQLVGLIAEPEDAGE